LWKWIFNKSGFYIDKSSEIPEVIRPGRSIWLIIAYYQNGQCELEMLVLFGLGFFFSTTFGVFSMHKFAVLSWLPFAFVPPSFKQKYKLTNRQIL